VIDDVQILAHSGMRGKIEEKIEIGKLVRLHRTDYICFTYCSMNTKAHGDD
jgi:hypothetical protein